MKKVSVPYLLVWVGISAIIGFSLGWYASRNVSLTSQLVLGAILTFFLALINAAMFFLPISRAITRHTGKKVKEMTFHVDAAFNSSSGMFYIDTVNGQVAAATIFNPFELQIINAKDMTDIKSDYTKGPLGGATQTYFCFKIGGTLCKISTFITNRAYSLNSSEVLTGISKADEYAEILTAAKDSASL